MGSQTKVLISIKVNTKYLTLIILLLMICLSSYSSTDKSKQNSPKKAMAVNIDELTDVPSKLKWEDFENFYFAKGSYISKLYKNLLIEKYKGKSNSSS